MATLNRCRSTGRPPVNDTGSLPMALLMILVGMSLSALIVPIVVLHTGNTKASVANVHALHAAQAGLDVALGQLRAAKDGDGMGSVALLPCAPLHGSVGNGNTGTFTVTLSYVESNPQGGWTASDAMSCPLQRRPSHVLLVSVGADGTATRSLRGTYLLGSTNANIPGGAIRVFPVAGNPDLCMDAGSVTPQVGTAVTVRPCVDGATRQGFGYYTDLSLVYVSSRKNPTSAAPHGLCIDAGVTQALGNTVTLRPCSASAPGHQQWGFTDDANFAGTTDAMENTDLCINVQYTSSTTGDLALGSCAHVNDTIGVFAPDPTVGAGAAGMPITDGTGKWRQLVNYRQFGRCLDVPLFNTGSPFLIAWPCKQGTTKVGWNQKWSLPTGPGQIKIYYPSTATYYCLRTADGPAGSYVTLEPCGAVTAATTWTARSTPTGDWDTGYRIIDSFGRCLATKDAAKGDYFEYGYEVSKVIVDTCSLQSPDNELQHWNAPPDVDPPAPLIDIAER